jgi:hypothetical protein
LRALTFPGLRGLFSSPFTLASMTVNKNLIDGRMDALPVYAATRFLFSLLPWTRDITTETKQ